MLLKVGLLFDGTGEPPRRDCYLNVEGGMVAAVGRAGDFAAAAVRTAVDHAACTALPGLIDCHVHLFLEGIADTKTREARWHDSRELTLLRAAKNAASSLRRGVTAVRDLGGPPAIAATLQTAVAEKVVAGPRILTCRQAISAPGGHFHYAGGIEADGPVAVGRAAREQVRAGADVVKLMVTGMVDFRTGSAGACELSKAEVQAAVREAARRGRPVAVHANGADGVGLALAAGVRTIEHGALLDEAAVDRLAASETYWVPTLLPFSRMLAYARERRVASLPADGLERVYAAHRAAVARAVAAGARVAAGTDAGSLAVNHGEVWQEAALLAELGLSPAAAIRAATGLAAAACGLTDTGTLTAGKRADILVVAGDPTADIKALGQVVQVYKDGEAVL